MGQNPLKTAAGGLRCLSGPKFGRLWQQWCASKFAGAWFGICSQDIWVIDGDCMSWIWWVPNISIQFVLRIERCFALANCKMIAIGDELHTDTLTMKYLWTLPYAANLFFCSCFFLFKHWWCSMPLRNEKTTTGHLISPTSLAEGTQ